MNRPWEIYSSRQRMTFLAVLFLVSTSNYLDRNIIGVLLEPIKAEFGVSDMMLGLLTGLSFAVFYATLGIPVARWADRGDRKLIITGSLVVWSAMTMLCGLAQSFWQLALARVGVGAGEAGAVPASHSLIADYFPPERRAWAIGVFTMSSLAGYVLGLSGGGWVAQHYGWRMAFVVAGIPGVLLGILSLTLLEEPRKLPQFAVRSEATETIWQAFRALLAKPAYVNILIALTLYFFMAYGALVFTVSFMLRVHDVDLVQAGAIYGLLSAAAAVIGSLVGGVIADRQASIQISRLATFPGWGLIAAWPLYELAFAAPSIMWAAIFFFVGGVLLAATVPPMFACLQLVCGAERRATAVAIAFFFSNLIGLGLGPVLIGALSDAFGLRFGVADGLRYALMAAMLLFLPTGYFMLRAGRYLPHDRED